MAKYLLSMAFGLLIWLNMGLVDAMVGPS